MSDENPSDLEAAVFDFLSRKYMQREDARQRSMGLVYMTAETHDLARELARFIERHQRGESR